ncbi:MAG TPA: hypothetical protein VMT99_01725 [Candidatus Paceibacterota bacterium]|nr:hypothetical protein [Candidatus Paceibacterota bacterium]
MKAFVRNHPETVLVACAIAFIGGIAACYSWGTNDIIAAVNNAFNGAPSQTPVKFDIDTASGLNWHGVSTTTPAGPQAPAAAPSVPTSTPAPGTAATGTAATGTKGAAAPKTKP